MIRNDPAQYDPGPLVTGILKKAGRFIGGLSMVIQCQILRELFLYSHVEQMYTNPQQSIISTEGQSENHMHLFSHLH